MPTAGRVPVAPGIGRFFVPLNRGKRSIVLDLKSSEGRAALAGLIATAEVVVHNSPPARAAGVRDRLGAAARLPSRSRGRHRHLVRPARPPRRRTGLRPRRAGTIRASDLTRLARRYGAGSCRRDPDGRPDRSATSLRRGCWRRSCGRDGRGGPTASRSRCSARRSPSRSRISSWLDDEAGRRARRSDPSGPSRSRRLQARLVMNPSIRCYGTADGSLQSRASTSATARLPGFVFDEARRSRRLRTWFPTIRASSPRSGSDHGDRVAHRMESEWSRGSASLARGGAPCRARSRAGKRPCRFAGAGERPHRDRRAAGPRACDVLGQRLRVDGADGTDIAPRPRSEPTRTRFWRSSGG